MCSSTRNVVGDAHYCAQMYRQIASSAVPTWISGRNDAILAPATTGPTVANLVLDGEEAGAMSHYTVGIAIDALLTDEDLRARFAVDPIETLAHLSFRGVALTPEEIDVFMQTDARVWSWNRDLTGGRVH